MHYGCMRSCEPLVHIRQSLADACARVSRWYARAERIVSASRVPVLPHSPSIHSTICLARRLASEAARGARAAHSALAAHFHSRSVHSRSDGGCIGR